MVHSSDAIADALYVIVNIAGGFTIPLLVLFLQEIGYLNILYMNIQIIQSRIIGVDKNGK